MTYFNSMKGHSIGVQILPHPKAYCMKFQNLKTKSEVLRSSNLEKKGKEISESQKDRSLCYRGN
jgi:hypothetical protein